MPKGFYKHKLLLDENMPHRTDFPILNSKFDVKHIEDDFGKGGLPDPDVYQLAVDQKRILITFNSKHFRSRAGTKDDAGIVVISANMPSSQVDTKLTALLIRSTLNGLNLHHSQAKRKFKKLQAGRYFSGSASENEVQARLCTSRGIGEIPDQFLPPWGRGLIRRGGRLLFLL